MKKLRNYDLVHSNIVHSPENVTLGKINLLYIAIKFNNSYERKLVTNYTDLSENHLDYF